MKIFFLILLFSISSAEEKYSKVKIPVANKTEMKRLATLGLAIDHFGGRIGNEIEVFLSETEIEILKSNQIPFTYLIEDWDKYYSEEQKKSQFQTATRITSTPKNFHLGSMAGFYTLKESMAELDSMRKAFPNFVSKNDTIGFTLQGRPIIAIKISSNPNISENKSRALYTALHHAREPESLTQLYYFIWHLLENYQTDKEINFILNNRELYFIPVLNPDGYFYNERTKPTGGGMWRKNRYARGVNDTVGVDLNRNYGFKWGYNDEGSSSSPTSETYRGPAAFSEKETQAVRGFCNNKKFSVAFNYHTYSNLLIYPWGFNDVDTPDSILYRNLANELATVHRYAYGTGIQTVGYNVNGDSDDWMYGDTIAKPKIISYTPEVGNAIDGFWPKVNRIIPLAEENLRANLSLAQSADVFYKISESDFIHKTLAETSFVDIKVANIGVRNSNSQIKIRATNIINRSNIFKIIDSVAILTPILGVDVYRIRLLHNNGFCIGDTINSLAISISTDKSFTLDTLNFIDGIPNMLLVDDFESPINLKWNSTSSWGVSTNSKNGLFALTESPNGLYANNLSTTITLKNIIYLLNVASAELRFWMKGSIETNYDFLKIQISNDSGKSWKSLKGKYTSEGSGIAKQVPIFEHGYDAIYHDWKLEKIFIPKSQLSNNILIRFKFESDGYENLDGWLIDDLKFITYYDFICDVNENDISPNHFELKQNYPNPFNNSTIINYQIPVNSFVTIKVHDLLGREISTLLNEKKEAGSYQINFKSNNLSSGIYLYRIAIHSDNIKAGNFNQTKKLIILK